jgi:hypothetical protein
MAKEIRRGETKMAAISRGVDWATLWGIRSDVFLHDYLGELQNPPWHDIRKKLCDVFMDTGQIIGMEPLRKRGLIEASNPQITDEVEQHSGTAFTTVTVNLNFRTAAHTDSGDLPEG